MGKCIHVYATETRPALQGARLTAYELKILGIPCTLLVDGAAGMLMREGRVDKVIVGGDRVLLDGHLFNKVGTYTLAQLARAHGIPFYCAVPTSTIDPTSKVEDVVVEQRSFMEVVKIMGRRVAPRGVGVYNPVFDVTPPDYISSFITERGVATQPYSKSLPEIKAASGQTDQGRIA
jgi:methylthioribose-1-phosphate isomerase